MAEGDDRPGEAGQGRGSADGDAVSAPSDPDSASTPSAPDNGRPSPDAGAGGAPSDADTVEDLRSAVEEQYDFEDFGPADMASMSREEWESAFDPETWITGEVLIDRVADDLRTRIANREVFARLERYADPPRLLAYSEASYAMVYPDGSVEGEGSVLRDVKPSVALCSMESYDVPEPPADYTLPDPEVVAGTSSELGNRVLQVLAGVQVLAALVLVGAAVFAFGQRGANAIVLFVAGLAFLLIGVVLFVVVANARLSDSFRVAEYRDRLRDVGLAGGERPEFLPPPPDGPSSDPEGTGPATEGHPPDGDSPESDAAGHPSDPDGPEPDVDGSPTDAGGPEPDRS